MEENVVSLISKLSSCLLGSQSVKNSLKEKKNHKASIKHVSRAAYDVIRRYEAKEEFFVIGGLEWYPDIWISDYGYDLMHNGFTRGSELLFSSLNQINQRQYDSINEIWKFLLELKKPFDEKNIEQHPFSLSGQDYFLRSQNAYQLLPNDLIGSIVIEDKTTSIDTSIEDNTLLDLFVEKPKATVTAKNTLCLDDFLGEKTVNISLNRKKPVIDDKKIHQNPSAILARCISPSSGIEKDIFEGEEFSEEINKPAASFIKSYEDSLTSYQNDVFALRNHQRNEKASNLVLGIYLEDVVLKQLIDPSHELAQPTEISLNDYVSQVKYVLCGINTNIFIYDDIAKKFYMKVGVYVERLSPSTLFEISQIHLRTGTYLKSLTELEDYHSRDNCGILYSVFWKSVQDYLHKHCDAVSLISESCTLMGLELVTADLHSTMAAVYKLCLENKNATTGGLLLNFLFASCNSIQQECVRKVVMSFFYDCCAVYLIKHLEKWAFQGCLLNQWSADMFVYINPELSIRRDRACYSSISLEESQVPKFLTTLASKIFSCGKAVWLLKLFDPENKFIHYLDAMKNPKMKICTKEDDFKILENAFIKYQEDITNLCGPEISFKTFLKVDIDDDQILKNKELKSRRDEYESKKIHQAREKIEMKKKLYKEQLDAATQERERKLKIKNEERRRVDHINEKLFIEEEKKDISNKYQSLTDNVEKYINLKEWQNKRLELNDKRMKFLQEDYLNKNTLLDNEGNVVSSESVFCDSVDDPTKKMEALSDAEKIKQRNLRSQFILSLSPTKMIVDDSPVDETNKLASPSSLKDIVIASLLNKNDKNLNLENKVVDNSNENLKMDIINRNETADSLCYELPLVGMDVVNSNQEGKRNAGPLITDAMRNKSKILGTEYNFAVWAEGKTTTKNKQILLGKEDNILNKNEEACIELTDSVKKKAISNNSNLEKTENTGTVLTDAMKNKLKVLGTEYNLYPEKTVVTEHANAALTEAMKNKIKALGSDHNITPTSSIEKSKKLITNSNLGSDEVDSLEHTSKIDSGEMSEAQKNKLKVLGTEYNLPPTTKEKKNQVNGPFQINKLKGMGSDIVFVAESENVNKAQTYCKKETSNDQSAKVTENLPEKTKTKLVGSNNFINPTITDESRMLSKIVNYSKPVDCFDSNIDILTFTRSLQRSINIVIETQEHLANVFILKHFLLKENLLAHITSIRCYFLLYDGEFSRNLSYGMFQALTQSSEPHHFFDRSLLSNILNEALIYTSIDAQVNANHLSFQILKMPKHLNVEAHDLFSPFQLAYKVKWPLNIIITDPSIDRYRKVFHLLINLKRVHWTLNEAFLLLKAQTKDSTLDGIRLMKSPEYTKLATYRYAMTLFVITVEEHISGYGLQVAWIDFIKNLENVSNLDELYQKHVSFVKDLCRRCFLVKASQDLLSYIHELIELGLQFFAILKSGKWHLINETHYSHPKFTALKIVFNKFCKTTKNFNKTLRKKTTYPEMKIHLPLLELINLKIIV